jgi:hypothetical protein
VLGKRARALAEEQFDIARIGAEFDAVLHDAVRIAEHAREPVLALAPAGGIRL